MAHERFASNGIVLNWPASTFRRTTAFRPMQKRLGQPGRRVLNANLPPGYRFAEVLELRSRGGGSSVGHRRAERIEQRHKIARQAPAALVIALYPRICSSRPPVADVCG
jgi:hypothetical protein